MFGKMGVPELLVILTIVIVIFGPKQLPKLGKTFGKTLKGFKDGVGGELNEQEEISE
ncbi:MAG: twin-arginine translocase TatA/TatE family subunit [Niameybacter sp.]|uniref:twin-arginine translocase TatA/TatE family subunit n=1 Tax=Niameybacter sp. TaxID=2033640 RepID=UPI002FC96DFE